MVPRTLVGALVWSVAAAATGFVGCATSAGFPDFATNSGSTSSAVTLFGTSDASTVLVTPIVDAVSEPVQVALTQGSPLCNASHVSSTCYPDDPTTAQACDTAADGAAGYDPDAGYGDAALGCHVVAGDAGDDAGVGPACLPAGLGAAGSACRDSTDCAPTYECVGASGAGTCRRYCCYTACGAGTFCDVQPEANATGPATVAVPVCMPVRPCGLLGEVTDAGACAQYAETCAVVSLANGYAESCVATGPAAVGESCDARHCGAGLTCLGAWGSRLCYKLCHTTDASSDCPPTQACAGGLPLFSDPMTGVCKTASNTDQ